MKTLFIGGVKSGKSSLAEAYILRHPVKPVYLATTEFIDEELQRRILKHQEDRQEKFTTLEEPLHLYEALKKQDAPVLVECLTMWLNNMLFHGKNEDEIFKELDLVLSLSQTIVFVLNDVGSGIIPDNALAREFVDLSGKVSQKLGSACDDVYHVIAGLQQRIK